MCSSDLFSAALRLGSSLKSWKTQPMLRRSCEMRDGRSREMSRPPTMIVPCVGSISLSNRRIRVDLPEPYAPTMKTNSPLSIWKEMLLRARTFGS